MLQKYTFGNENSKKAITAYQWNGRTVFVANEVGEAAGYKEGRHFVDTITKRWAKELFEGIDYIKLEGEELQEFLQQFASGTRPDAKTRSLLLLTESGANITLIKGKTDGCSRLRRFLAEKVIPALAKGQLAPVKENQEAVALDKVLEALRLRSLLANVDYLLERISDGSMPKELGFAALTTLFEKANGVPLVGARQKIRTDLTSCSELGARFKMSSSMVGQIITWIKTTGGVDLRNDPVFCVRETVAAANHGGEGTLSREVEGFKLTEEGVKSFEAFLPDFIKAHPTSVAAKPRGTKKSAIRKALEKAGQKQLPFKKLNTAESEAHG